MTKPANVNYYWPMITIITEQKNHHHFHQGNNCFYYLYQSEHDWRWKKQWSANQIQSIFLIDQWDHLKINLIAIANEIWQQCILTCRENIKMAYFIDFTT